MGKRVVTKYGDTPTNFINEEDLGLSAIVKDNSGDFAIKTTHGWVWISDLNGNPDAEIEYLTCPHLPDTFSPYEALFDGNE